MNATIFQESGFNSARCSYSLYQNSDLKEVHALLCLPIVDKYNTLGVMKTIAETEHIMCQSLASHRNEQISNFTIVLREKAGGMMIGLLGMNLQNPKYMAAEIWFKLLPDFWGQGYATEAVEWLFSFGFEKLKLHRIIAGCATLNIASFKVLEKVGMRREGLSQKALPLDSGWVDTFEYAILEDEYHMNKMNNQNNQI